MALVAAEGTAVKTFFSDLNDIVGPRVLAQVLLKMRENDLLGLAGQLTYFFLLSFFPFLIFLVALAGLVLNDPESGIRALIGKSAGFLPREAIELLVGYLDRTLRGAGPGVLLVGILTTLWMGSAASIAIIKAANRPTSSRRPGRSGRYAAPLSSWRWVLRS